MLAEFAHDEAAGAVVLVVATVVGLAWANLATAGYQGFWGREVRFDLIGVHVGETYAEVVNDGFMAIFFFVVGLEIKRERVVGELRDRRAAALPFFAAIGGMVVPALVFLALNATDAGARRGWAIPMATDIAFVMGVIALLGRRLPPPLRLFLLTLAIVDDIGAILVIAAFYTDHLVVGWLVGAFAVVAMIVAMRRLGVRAIWPYVLVGLPLWFCVLESGVHATIAGVVLGLLTPARPVDGRSVLEELEHFFHPISAFVVVPIFAVANTGIVLSRGSVADALSSTLAWGVMLGLLVGKPVGITLATTLGRALKVGRLPAGLELRHVMGGGIVAGIGFTVSLFVTELSFGAGPTGDVSKLAILTASALAAAAGSVVLLRFGLSSRTTRTRHA
jgi:NhaA family Na+:H+ antiporter